MPDIIDLIDGTATEHFDSIYEELLFKASHSNPNYIDPAVAAKAIMQVVNERFAHYFFKHRESVAEFSKAMHWLGSSLLIDNHEYIQTTIDQRRAQLIHKFKWAEAPAITTGRLATT